MGRIAHRLAGPARARTLPVLKGPGKGLKVRTGDAYLRVLGRGEPRVEHAFLNLLQPDMVVYDVGANIGWFSLLAARHGCRVFAFEPDVQNAALVRDNARANRLDVTITPAALTDEDGWLMFLHRGSLKGRLEKSDTPEQAKRRARREVSFNARFPVPAARLDTWIAQTSSPAPAVVKIDVEGAEVGVLRGMRDTLRTCCPTLIIELHSTGPGVADELDQAGYRHSTIQAHGNAREASSWEEHVLATPLS